MTDPAACLLPSSDLPAHSPSEAAAKAGEGRLFASLSARRSTYRAASAASDVVGDSGKKFGALESAVAIIAELEKPQCVCHVGLRSDLEHDRFRAPRESASEAGLDQGLRDGPRVHDVRLGVEVDVPELFFAEVEVGAVDLSFIAQQPVRPRVNARPLRERL
jgi:hypothetical protein